MRHLLLKWLTTQHQDACERSRQYPRFVPCTQFTNHVIRHVPNPNCSNSMRLNSTLTRSSGLILGWARVRALAFEFESSSNPTARVRVEFEPWTLRSNSSRVQVYSTSMENEKRASFLYWLWKAVLLLANRRYGSEWKKFRSEWKELHEKHGIGKYTKKLEVNSNSTRTRISSSSSISNWARWTDTRYQNSNSSLSLVHVYLM